MTYIQTTSPRTAVFYGESMADLALMPTTTKIGEGEYIHALAQEGSYAIILLTDGLKKFMLRSTGWVEVKDQGGGGSSWFEPGGNTTFAELPTPSRDNVGIVYNITDAFTTDERFNEGTGVNYPAGTNVAIVNVGTAESPVLKYDTFAGAYVVDNALSDASENPVQNKVIKSALDGKATPADIAALINDTTAAQNKTYSSAKVEEKVAGEEITTTATGSDLTLSTSSGNLNKLTVYGKSEIVDGAIKSAGEGWATVDLGTLSWAYSTNTEQGWAVFTAPVPNIVSPSVAIDRLKGLLCPMYPISANSPYASMQNKSMLRHNGKIVIKDNDFTDATAFKNSLNGIILAYEEATPANNTIAINTDNGSGTNGTMAVVETGAPLRGIPDTTVRDVKAWNGSAGAVTKNCGVVDLGTLTWGYVATDQRFYTYSLSTTIKIPANENIAANIITPKYITTSKNYLSNTTPLPNEVIAVGSSGAISLRDTNYTEPTDLANALSGVMLVYELATPVTIPLTSTENDSIAGMRTFAPTTHAQNNAQTDMTVEAYSGTANGKAVSELKQDVQSEISALKITQSATLTLTVADWSSNQQTITYAHDTAKRNVIDVDPASVEEWASCGVLATAETASGITFSCKTVPTNALTFRVTSMGV